MHTSFLHSSKATALALAFTSLLFSFLFMPAPQALAEFTSKASTEESGYTNLSDKSNGGFTKNAPESSAVSLQARLDAALKQIASLQARIAASGKNGTFTEGGHGRQCTAFTRTFRKGATDAGTNGEVSRLQKHLASDKAVYPEAEVTGFYGPATEKAVQRFQSKYGIAKTGTPETTGYGSVGGQTRLMLEKLCSSAPLASATYSLADVTSISVVDNRSSDKNAIYTITLTSGTKRIVTIGARFTEAQTAEVFKKSGYTGDVSELLLSEKPVVLLEKYNADDVELITFQMWGQPVKGSTNQNHILGKVFTIILKDGTVRKVYDNSIVGVLYSVQNILLSLSSTGKKNFPASGFRGDVANLLRRAVYVEGVDLTNLKDLPKEYAGLPEVKGVSIDIEFSDSL